MTFFQSLAQVAPQVSTSCAGLTRASIIFVKSLSKRMDCRVEPGNDDFYEWCSNVQPPTPSARPARTESESHRATGRVRIRRQGQVDAARLHRARARRLSRQCDRAS